MSIAPDWSPKEASIKAISALPHIPMPTTIDSGHEKLILRAIPPALMICPTAQTTVRAITKKRPGPLSDSKVMLKPREMKNIGPRNE